MAREFAAVNLSIWQDADWRKLPPEAQHLYLVLWTHPALTYCGVTDWRPGRIAASAGGWDIGTVYDAAACLEARHFLIIDDETEEVLIRSWIRFDGLMSQPVMAVSMAKAFATIASNDIRGVIVHELARLKAKEPEFSGWKKAQVSDILDQPAVDPRSLDLPDDPFDPDHPYPPRKGSINPSDYPLDKGKAGGSVNPSDNPPSTPSPSPSPLLPASSTKVEGSRADQFERFWEIYPKKVNKADARRKFATVVRSVDLDTLLAGLRRYVEHITVHRTDKQFIKGPEVWLNKGCWEDEYDAPPKDPDAWMNGGRERSIVKEPFDEYAMWNPA